MSIADKLTTIAENEQKIYNKGGLDVSPQENVSGEMIRIKDISPIEHNMSVKVSGVEDISTVKLYRQGKNWLSVGLVKGNFTPTSTSGNNLSNQSGVISSYGFYLKTGTYTVSGIGDTYNLFINGMTTTTKTSGYQDYRDKSRKFTIPTDGLYNLQFNKISGAEMLDIATLKVQVENGEIATEYEPYVEPTTYEVPTDGTVEGVKSLYPSTTLYTDTNGAVIECTYYQDGRKVKENLKEKILSLGGTIND